MEEEPPNEDLALRDLPDRFEVIEEVSSTRWYVTYRARDKTLDREVFLKLPTHKFRGEVGRDLHETIMRRVMPGEGVFELDRFCETLRAKGFDGVVSCEILSVETRAMPLAAFAERVYQASRRYWP